MNRLIKAIVLTGAMLIAATSSEALDLSSTFTNLDFDASTQAYFPLGFDNASYDIPGWRDYGTPTDSGIEAEGAWWSPYQQYSAFMAAGNGCYNLSSYTIGSGDVFTISSFMKGWWGGNTPFMEVTLFYGSDPAANAFGTWTTPAGNTTWTEYVSDQIVAPPVAVGQTLGVRVVNTSTFFVNFDELAINLYPFDISVSPQGTIFVTDPTITATVNNINSSTFVSATLSLDGAVVDTDNTAGTSHTLSYAASGLSLGVHTGEVVAVSTTESMTNTWTFTIAQPPFNGVTVSPTDLITTDSTTLEAVVIENFSIVDSAQMWLDGTEVTPTINRSAAPTSTVSYAATGLANGVHSAKVVVVGSPNGLETNEWTFSVLVEPVKPVVLLHHWDFEEGGGTTVLDSVGSAHGTIVNTNYAWVSSDYGVAGGVDLFGGGSSAQYDVGQSPGTNNVGSFIDLPNGLLTALPAAVTFEATYIADDGGWWQRVWDMGTDSSHAENVVGTGAENIFLTPHSNSGSQGIRASVATNSPGYSHEYSQLEDSSGIRTGALVHVVWIYDTDASGAKLYINGQLEDQQALENPWPLSSFAGLDVNNWIGRAQYNDPMFNGKIYDFRIYSGFMTEAQVAARYAEVQSSGPTVEPVIQNIAVAGGQVTLTWTAEDTGSYSIQRKTDLSAPTWSTVMSNLPSGNYSTNVSASGADLEVYQIMGE